jgi:hypothetical protein
MDVDVEEEEAEEKKPVIDAKESGKGVEASATEVQGADDDQEGVAALLMLLAAPYAFSYFSASPSPCTDSFSRTGSRTPRLNLPLPPPRLLLKPNLRPLRPRTATKPPLPSRPNQR